MTHDRTRKSDDILFTFAYGKEMIRAFLVFGLLLGVIIFIASRLAFRELSLSVWTAGTTIAQREAQTISDLVVRFGREAGGINFQRVRDNREPLEDYIRQRLGRGLPIHSVEIRDRFGVQQLFVQQASALRPRPVGGAISLPSDWPAAVDRVIRAPLGRSEGEVLVAVAADPLLQEWLRLRRSLQIKVAIAASLAIGLLVSGLFYVLNLIRRNRDLEQARQSAARASYVGLLASGLAHEIRNPLNAMNMNLQMLEEELEGIPQDQEHDFLELVESNKSEIKRLERLVNNFLAYARPSSPQLESLDLNELLLEIVRFLAVDFKQSEVMLEMEFEPLLPNVEIDAAQFKQALMNLLVNARQVLPPGGRVIVRTRAGSKGDAVIEIEDDGPGIPAEKQERIFDVFYSSRGGGTGLGLPIARQIVEQHGGRIDLRSELGRGTTFCIHLPRRQRSTRSGSATDDVQ